VHRPSNIAVGNIPIGMAAIGREAWVSNAADNTISKVDLDTNTTIGAPFPVAENPRAIVVLDGALYYASAEEGIIQAIDPANNALGFSLPFPGGENANLGQLVTVDDRLYAGGLNEVFEIAFCASPSTTTTTTPGSSPATPAAQPARAVTGTTPSFTG
jgi:DNA-binding beta-propeller fold protein YncE